MTNHFDQVAQTWDNNPVHSERTEAIAAELVKMIPIKQQMTALEFGSGTGLLSFALKDLFTEITLMDSSLEMNKQAQIKINETGAKNLLPWNVDLEKVEIIKGSFDVIFTQMALHHVKDIPALLGKFYTLLHADGYLAIADLFSEDGTFHDKSFDGHYGFDPDYIKDQIVKAGFMNLVLKQCFEIKRLENGIEKVFPIFLVVAQKSEKVIS